MNIKGRLRTVGATVLLMVSGVTQAQTLAKEADCNAIGGTWDFNTQPPQVYRCVLSQYYEVRSGTRLEVFFGVELEVSGNGVLENRGQLEVRDTGLVHINGGTLINNTTLYADNRAEVTFTRGSVRNQGSLNIEGDVVINNTYRRPDRSRECLINNGTITLFSGGNLISEGGCIDTFSSGMTEVLETGTMIIGRDAIYRTRGRHTINGRVLVEAGGFAELSAPTISGELDVYGRVTMPRGVVPLAQARSEFLAGSKTRIEQFASVIIDTRGLQIDGDIAMRNTARLHLNSSDINIGETGVVSMRNGSKTTTNTVATNEGTIYRDCLSFWDGPVPSQNKIISAPCTPFRPKAPFGPIVFP
ncbi:MAG: hypothetical protein AAGA84_02580 [Pseudomonadota bacterium]